MIDQDYDSLKHSSSFDAMKPSLREHIKRQAQRYKQNPEDSQTVAYELAGLLSLPQLAGAPDDDPYIEILLLAGQLELPRRRQEANASWRRLVDLADAL